MTPGGRTPRAGLSPGGRTPRGLDQHDTPLAGWPVDRRWTGSAACAEAPAQAHGRARVRRLDRDVIHERAHERQPAAAVAVVSVPPPAMVAHGHDHLGALPLELDL